MVETNNIHDYIEKNCENFLFNMCKVRNKSHRNCVLPRCCAICPELLYCEGKCVFIKDLIKKEDD